MATMKTLNGYGFNATEFNGKAPEYYLQPRNLLDNSDFTNPVNQRGVYSAVNGSYIIDRWFFYNSNFTGNVTITQSANGITITNDAGADRVAIVQKIIDKNYYDGKYTAVAKTTDGLLFGYTEVVDAENGICQVPFWFSSGTTVVWAALYEGSYTADTFPPYVPKGYAAEQAECQRYYYHLQEGTNFIFRSRNQHGTNNYSAFDICPNITFPVPMRIVPTVSMVYDITDGTSSVGAPFDCSRTSCTVPNVTIPPGGWFDLNRLVASADL